MCYLIKQVPINDYYSSHVGRGFKIISGSNVRARPLSVVWDDGGE